MSASSGKAALEAAEARAGAAGKMATMAILARAETGCQLTRDPDDTVRRRGKPEERSDEGPPNGPQFLFPISIEGTDNFVVCTALTIEDF